RGNEVRRLGAFARNAPPPSLGTLLSSISIFGPWLNGSPCFRVTAPRPLGLFPFHPLRYTPRKGPFPRHPFQPTMTQLVYEFAVIVVGAGHAGVEAALAAARLGLR